MAIPEKPAPRPAPAAPKPAPAPSGGGLGAYVVRLLIVASLATGGYLFWQKLEMQREEARAKAGEAAAAAGAKTPPKATASDFADMIDNAPPPPPPDAPTTPAPVEPDLPVNDTPPPVVAPAPQKGYALTDLAEGRAALEAFTKAKFTYTPEVERAYLAYMKARTRAQLKDAGTELPADFLAWAENDTDLALAIYGARRDPAALLGWLRSLEIDLGRDVVRAKYRQFALAVATVATAKGDKPDLTPRPPYKLTIGGDPRVPVNTKDPKRTLDMNDHIINFLEDHAPISGDIVGGMAEALPELVYDSRGVATSLSKKKNASPKVKRKLIAADVFASAELQREFNAYMKAKGFPVDIDCGDRVIFPGQTEAVKAPHEKAIERAFALFRTAYEEKGRLARRDAPATYAERFAYVIRNDTRAAFPDTYGPQKRKLPSFPLNAPWPMLTYLAFDDQPLREREDTVMRLKKKGEFHTYGEYIGDIAQQTQMQRARRLAPFEFGYKTVTTSVDRDPMAMMIKDGGVCGTMAAMAVCSYGAVNVPATPAGQPGHCAFVYATVDPKTRKYAIEGGQYVTAGHEGTRPFCSWYFGDINAKKMMIWHIAAARAVNFGDRAFMQSLTAAQFLKALPDDLRAAHEPAALAAATTINPYDIAVADAAIAAAPDAAALLRLRQSLKSAIIASSAKAGNEPDGGLYLKTLEALIADRLDTLPAPADAALAKTAAELRAKRAADLAAEAAAKAAKAAKEAADKAAKEAAKNAPAKGATKK